MATDKDKNVGNVLQFVTFQLGSEQFAINIMEVDEIYSLQPVRPIPHAPQYVEGILNLRGHIIPIISLHQRFRLARLELTEDDELLSCFIILDIEGSQVGIIVDKILKVVSVNTNLIQGAPQLSNGIGEQYIQGVINQNEEGYLTILDIARLFDMKELSKLQGINTTAPKLV